MSGLVRGGRDRRRRQAGGFALLTVLWTLPLLSLIASGLILSGRQEVEAASNTRNASIAEAAADGAVYNAAWQVFSGQWQPGASSHSLRIGAAAASVTVGSEAGKINPNIASLELLRLLLIELNVDAPSANAIAAAIVDFRSPGEIKSHAGAKTADYEAAGLPYGPTGRPFTSLDELGLVLGVTPELLALMQPHLSLYQEGGIDPHFADPVVQRVLDDRRVAGLERPGDGVRTRNVVSEITAVATSAEGARFRRRAIIRFRAAPADGGPPYQILAWDRL